jgi:quinol-cytochrome oxidoreductase complex cytochrome b subunit
MQHLLLFIAGHLHIARVYLTGGFLKPREFIWITGIILAVTKFVTSVPEALDN